MARPRCILPPSLLALAALLLIAAALGPATAAAAPSATNVVGGEAAVRGSFPYLAFVYFREGAMAETCTGTVVSSNVILTAAHCAVDEEHGVVRSPAGFRVVTGNVEWGASERVVSSVSAVAVDPEYAWSGEYAHWADAALLQLSQPIAAPPVKLASSEAWVPGSAALMVGWGKESATASGPSAVLRYGTTAVQSAAYCGSKASHFHAAGQLCALDAPEHLRSACNGDSGGPLLVVNPGTASEPLEIGIASFIVNASCAPTSPQYYTRADLVAPWVAAQVALAVPSAPPAASAPAAAPAAPVAAAAAPRALPRLGDGSARGYVRTALAQAFGGRFQRRGSYRVECEAIEAPRRACAVSWGAGPYLYSGWVTVFYALEANRVVWRSGYRVKRTVASCGRRRCPSQLYRG